MGRVTIRDLGAALFAVGALAIIGVLAVEQASIPDILIVLVTAASTYFFRGVENGGFKPKNGSSGQ